MKMTKNRLLILEILSFDIAGDLPPHSASSIHYALGEAVSKQHIHKTLSDLLLSGLIVVSRQKQEGYAGRLPYWERSYQQSGQVESNHIKSKADRLYKKVDKAMHGINFFGKPFNYGLSVADVEAVTREVKIMMQKAHPDKQDGFRDQFEMMTQCMKWIRAGVPLPTDSEPKQRVSAHALGATSTHHRA
jgi:hypothetical protein